MSLHIGKRIKEVLERQGRTKVWFASAINRSRTACYDIFKNPTIDTELLILISKALKHDFLIDLSADAKVSEK
ncbi:MAG: XRE family transcriptional regulator [Bacteroidales bacterium]|nr:XRE family transcriptional regulator [Bacteroidales bacterium]